MEMAMGKKTLIKILTALTVAVLSGCSATPAAVQDGSPILSGRATSPVPSSEPNTPVLDGPVSINSLPYSLPGTTGYQTSVTFTVVNPSDFPMVSSYRVSVRAGGRVIDTTTGGEKVVLSPHQTLIVVNEPSNIKGAVPDAATVELYPNEAGQMDLPDPAGWKLSNISSLNCNSGFVGCQLSADLSYQGATSSDTQLNVAATSIAFSHLGRVVVAGNLMRASNPAAQMMPGQPVPVTGYLNGNPGNAAHLTQAFGVQLMAPVVP